MERKITIEEEGFYREDYQMRMLEDNQIKGFLTVKGRGADEKSYYDYDVSGKVSLKALFEKNTIRGEDIRSFLKNLLSVIEEAEKYLLDIHHILLKPEYIYYEDNTYYFCYYPPGGCSLWEEFHLLTEYFVKHADYKEQDCVQMVFLLHKETMEENYSLEKVAAKCLNTEKEEEQQKVQDEKEDAQEDRFRAQEMESFATGETEDMWAPVKRFLNRHRKPKWGDFDGLYIEEEEL